MSVRRSERVEPGQPQIELRGVSQRYELQRARNRSFQEMFIHLFRRRKQESEAFWPLRDVSFSIYPGESVGIIGPNGAGKSTLLKLLSGILTPTSGDLTILGRISSLLELGAGFHPELTGRDNIYLNGSIYGLSRKQMDRQLNQIIEYAELGDFIDTPVKHYSSGMYVRLGFAVAIHTAPDLLMVDEVLAVGDATFQRKCLTSIQRFRDNNGTLLLVSHDLSVIQSICRRAIWLEDGRIQADGHPTDVVMAYLQHVAAKEEEKKRAEGQRSFAAEEADVEEADAEQSVRPAPVRRWGSGRVQITGVDFCDDEGNARTVFHNGDAITICIHYQAETPVEWPVFGLAIYHQNGTHICGPNTKFGELSLPVVQGRGTLRYRIPELPLLEGSYSVSAAVVNNSNTETLDYHDRLYEFQVYRGKSKEEYGLVTLNGAWSHEATGVLYDAMAPYPLSIART
jgi:ABC-type polysaccharide/polyol phosphate transport system ATPase subunit